MLEACLPCTLVWLRTIDTTASPRSYVSGDPVADSRYRTQIRVWSGLGKADQRGYYLLARSPLLVHCLLACFPVEGV